MANVIRVPQWRNALLMRLESRFRRCLTLNEKTESPEYIEVSKKYTVSPIQTINKEVIDDFGINKEKETVNIDLKIPKNFKTLYITGESGSGKSTILKYAFKVTIYDNDEFLNIHLIDMKLNII